MPSEPLPFSAGPCTSVTLGGDEGCLVALPYDTVRDLFLAVASDPHGGLDKPLLVQLPVLLVDEDEDWGVEYGLLRVDLVTSAVPWTPTPDEREAAVCAIGAARSERPQAFDIALDRVAPWADAATTSRQIGGDR